jgi:hypothetical protein
MHRRTRGGEGSTEGTRLCVTIINQHHGQSARRGEGTGRRGRTHHQGQRRPHGTLQEFTSVCQEKPFGDQPSR